MIRLRAWIRRQVDLRYPNVDNTLDQLSKYIREIEYLTPTEEYTVAVQYAAD